jgi:hypothetical protein
MIAKIRKLFHAGVAYLGTEKLSDEYIDWLTFANAGMLDSGTSTKYYL